MEYVTLTLHSMKYMESYIFFIFSSSGRHKVMKHGIWNSCEILIPQFSYLVNRKNFTFCSCSEQALCDIVFLSSWDLSMRQSCLRAVRPRRSVEPFAFWVKYLFTQIFAESLIVLSSCLLAVSLRVPCISVIHVRDTPNTKTNNNLSWSDHHQQIDI